MDNEEVIKEEIDEEVDDEFLDVKTKKDLNGKSTFSKIINIFLWIILVLWIVVCVWDFINVKSDKDPMFCIKKETTKYDDGEVDSCLGLGYKIFNYDRDSYKAREFGPFWAKDRSNK